MDSPAPSRPPTQTVASLWIGFQVATKGVRANKLRSFLTILGVIIGVGAVIVAIAIGQGSREAVTASIQRLGTNVLTVFPGQQRTGAVGMGFGSSQTLTLADGDAILQGCPSIVRVDPQVSRNVQFKHENKNENAQVNGVGIDYPLVSNHPIASGRFFTSAEDRARERLAVVGSTLATNLFGTDDPVGQTIQVSGQNFRVIGLLSSKGGQGFRNPDDSVYIPVRTAMYRLFGIQYVQNLTCQARSMDLMERAENEIGNLLLKRHRVSLANPDFMIFNQADLAAAQNEQQDTFSALITYLAVVSLGVGGIGIMNIMLVSVTERTHEIGIRKAVGARRRDVLTQFMLEALMLSAIGGLLGVLVGISGATIVGKANGWTVSIQPQTVLLAFSFSAFVGVFFGFYPAFKASKLHPIEALRYE
ncbi:MAG TPA: ABC transporter permease [Fimbriimonas sp.]|nr:ABC transporter permease [Fimbriimonas sp.]